MIIEAARAYLGVPFRHQGRTRRGVDCVGLVVLAATDAGFTIADRTDYSHRLTDNELLNGILSHCDSVTSPQPGDIALFQLPNHQQHCAVVTAIDPVYILHAYAPLRKVVEHRLAKGANDSYINQITLTGYYRLKA